MRSLLELLYLRLGTSIPLLMFRMVIPMLRDTKVAPEVDSLLFDVLPLVSFPICQGAYDVF